LADTVVSKVAQTQPSAEGMLNRTFCFSVQGGRCARQSLWAI